MDPLDGTHPDFVSWRAMFEKLGEQYPTATFREVQEKLVELRIILGDDGFHLTL